VVDVLREGLPLPTANTKFPKTVCPEGLQTCCQVRTSQPKGNLGLSGSRVPDVHQKHKGLKPQESFHPLPLKWRGIHGLKPDFGKSIPECAGFVHGAIPFDEEDVAGLKCAPKTGRENGGAFRTCTHALAECFSLHWPSNSAGVKDPSEE